MGVIYYCLYYIDSFYSSFWLGLIDLNTSFGRFRDGIHVHIAFVLPWSVLLHLVGFSYKLLILGNFNLR